MTVRPEISLWTDFNSITPEGWNVATVGVAGGTPIRPLPSETVELFDGEGHTCSGEVIEVRDLDEDVVVFVLADPGTWTTETLPFSMESDLLESLGAALARDKKQTSEASAEFRDEIVVL